MKLRTLCFAALLVGCGTTPSPTDAGTDAGIVEDAGPSDAGAEVVDAGLADAGDIDAGALDAGACTGDLEAQLRCVPGLSVTRLGMAGGFTRYSLEFTQPVDHASADAGTFQQRATLSVSNPDRPMVLITSGYFLIDRQHELSRVYGANQLSYEYRYFGTSKPNVIDWSTSTLAQGAADAHRLVVALKPLFPKKWVSAGVSKGGTSALAHRQHFPNDVDATVAYGTPYSSSRLDPRTAMALANDIGGPSRASCRAALATFQRELLMRKAELLPLVTTGTYTRLGKEKAFDHSVVDFGSTFWSYTPAANPTWGCPAVPAAGAPAMTLHRFLERHSPVDGLSDDAIATFQAYYVSTATELGGPAPYDMHLSTLLTPGEYAAGGFPAYLPPGLPLAQFAYRPEPQQALLAFVANQLTRTVFVSGENDPWKAQAYSMVAGGNLNLVVPEGLHTATVSEGLSAERMPVWAALDGWLEATAVAPRSLLPVEPAWHVVSDEERRFGQRLR